MLGISAMVENEGKVVGISFFLAEKLPQPLAEVAKAQDFGVSEGLIAVKTRIGSPPTYEFEEVGSTSKDIKAYMGKLAHEDGTEIDDALKRAFGTD